MGQGEKSVRSSETWPITRLNLSTGAVYKVLGEKFPEGMRNDIRKIEKLREMPWSNLEIGPIFEDSNPVLYQGIP